MEVADGCPKVQLWQWIPQKRVLLGVKEHEVLHVNIL